MLAGEASLGGSRIGKPQIVETELAGKPGLLVASEQRTSTSDVCPFGKPGTPPVIVFRNGIKLG
jgi:hypothetical protein